MIVQLSVVIIKTFKGVLMLMLVDEQILLDFKIFKRVFGVQKPLLEVIGFT